MRRVTAVVNSKTRPVASWLLAPIGATLHLPASEGDFNLALRMYWPKNMPVLIIDSSWFHRVRRKSRSNRIKRGGYNEGSLFRGRSSFNVSLGCFRRQG
jgi:hypothetical protein